MKPISKNIGERVFNIGERVFMSQNKYICLHCGYSFEGSDMAWFCPMCGSACEKIVIEDKHEIPEDPEIQAGNDRADTVMK